MKSYSILQSLPPASFTFFFFSKLLRSILLQGYTTFFFFLIHSQVDGHLGGFQFGMIMTGATIDIHVQIFV